MSDSEIKVSVLCVVFNHRKYIERCLNSMIGQKTDFRYEIIVHDDASTDGTQDIIRKYAEKYPDLIVPILQEKNQYSNRVDIIRTFLAPAARGRYITLLEGDDFWCDDHKLQKQADALEAHPDCVLCVHETDTVDAEGNPQNFHFPAMNIDHRIIPTDEFISLNLGVNNWPFHFSAFMVKADLYREYMEFKKTGFSSKFYRVGDLPLYLFFGLKGNTYYINETMSVYTIESGGFTSNAKKDPQFACRVNQGYIDGLTEFDNYTNHRYSRYVQEMLVIRRFEVARINRRFDILVKTPEFRPLIRKRGILKGVCIYAIGYAMAAYTGIVKKGHK